MLESPIPLIDHHVISITGRSPVVVLGLEATTPEQVEISIVIDLSDSCGDLSKLISHAKKLLSLLPRDWPISIFSLSSPDAISRPGLRLLDFIESDNLLLELCNNTRVISVSKRRGSFLRPVLETIGGVNPSTRRLLVVLTDGEFSDFGEFDIPARLEVVCILPNSFQTASELRKPILDGFTVLEMQDPQLDKIIASFTHPFFGPVVIEPILNTSMLDNLYRFVGDGKFIKWSSSTSHIVNLASGRQLFLFDGSLEDAQLIRWQIKSCFNQSIRILQSSTATIQPLPGIEELITRQFNPSQTDSITELICWSKRGDDQFSVIAEQFEQASILAAQGRSWINEKGNLQVFSNFAALTPITEGSRPQYSALLAIMVQCDQTGSPLHIALFSLRRDKNPAIRFQVDAPYNQLVANQNLSIRFDDSRYRWILESSGSKDAEAPFTAELEYYASEKLVVPLSHPNGSVTALFSGDVS
jgi:hypothetical protein